MLNVVMLNVVMLNVVMLNVIMVSVVAPKKFYVTGPRDDTAKLFIVTDDLEKYAAEFVPGKFFQGPVL
jgi:hypothetical protein